MGCTEFHNLLLLVVADLERPSQILELFRGATVLRQFPRRLHMPRDWVALLRPRELYLRGHDEIDGAAILPLERRHDGGHVRKLDGRLLVTDAVPREGTLRTYVLVWPCSATIVVLVQMRVRVQFP